MINNRKVKISHPMADTISISTGEGAYAGNYTSEVAFFSNSEWVVLPIPELNAYHDGSPSDSDTAVYGWVPNNILDEFLNTYRV